MNSKVVQVMEVYFIQHRFPKFTHLWLQHCQAITFGLMKPHSAQVEVGPMTSSSKYCFVPLLLQVRQPDRWLTKPCLNGSETPLVLPSCHCEGSRQNELCLHRPNLKYSTERVEIFLLINNRTENFPALSLWINEVAGQFVALSIQNRILKNKITFTSCILAEDMDGAEFYEEKMKDYKKKPHFSQIISPNIRSSFIRKTMHQTLLFGQRSSSTVPLTFLIACKIWGTCESFSWRGPEIQETGADMREW